MTLFNQHWIGYDGAPLTGATPPVLRVHGPRVMTPAQSGSVAHTYKLFSTVVASSPLPNGYHVQHRTLRDGSKVQLTSNNGQHLVDVWPAGGEGKPPERARGFAVRPDWDGTAVATWPDKATLVKYDTPNTNWIKWVSPYALGKDATPTYFLDAAKHTLPPKGVVFKKETNFADVYALSDSRLYLNGIGFKSLGAGPAAMPVLVRNLPLHAWFTVNNAKLDHVVETPTEVTRDTLWAVAGQFPDPSIGALGYDAGVRYKESADRIDYLRVIVTPFGATQSWRCSLALQAQAPWATTAGAQFQQLNAGVPLVYQHGYQTLTSETPTFPFIPLQNNNALQFTDSIWAEGPIPHPTYLRSVESINITLSDGGSLTLYPDMTANVERSVSINSHRRMGTGNFKGRYPPNKPAIWTAATFPTEDEIGPYGYFAVPAEGNNTPGVYGGQLVTDVLYEIGGKVDHNDTATSSTTVGALTIFSATATHDILRIEALKGEYQPHSVYSGPTPDPPLYSYLAFEPIHCIGDVCYGGWIDKYETTGWLPTKALSKSPGPEVSFSRKYETVTVNAEARDYLYFDDANGVYLYALSTLTGSYNLDYEIENFVQTSSTNSGTLMVTVKLVLQTPQGTTEVTVQTFNFTHGPFVLLVSPPGIPQNTTNLVWTQISPGIAPPIFTPQWFNQGACPHIAYTTAAEAASAAAHEPPLPFEHRLIASFRFRMLFRSRPQFAPVPDVPGAHEVYLPMLEAMLLAHFPGIFYYSFASLEAMPLVLNTSSPAGLMADIGLPHAQAHTEVYRT